MIHLPGQSRQQRIPQNVSLIDLVPTLLDLLGQPVPAQLQGRSRKAVLQGKAPLPSEDIFVEWSGTETGILERYKSQPLPESLSKFASLDDLKRAVADPIRTVITSDGWKFNWSGMGQHELFHHDKDSLETENLGARPEMRPKLEEMASKIREWQNQTGDTLSLCEL